MQQLISSCSIEMEGGTKNLSDPHLHQSFEPTADDFLEQMLSSLPNCAWPDLSNSSSNPNPLHHSIKPQDDSFPSFEDLTSKLRGHVNVSGNSSSMAAAKSFLLQQQLLLSRGGGLGSPSAPGGDSGLIPLPLSLAGSGNNSLGLVGDGSSFKSSPQGVDGSVQALFNGAFSAGPLHGNGQTTCQQPFQAGAMPAQNFGGPGPSMSQPPASVSTGGSGGQATQRQRVRARRGQATDPHSIAERLRRERIAERMKALQELVPNGNKTDKSSMLDEIIDYVKFLQLQVKVLSMSRLGGAAGVAPLVANLSSEGGAGVGLGRSTNGNPGIGSSTDGTSVTEHQVVKLMEEDMGSAMQYLQGKGLCLMPISLATAISTATCQPRNSGSFHNNNHRPMPPLNGNGNGGEGPTSPNLSALDPNPASKA